MIATATCTNPDCPELDVAKVGDITPGGDVTCGECLQLCRVEAGGTLPAPPPTLEERVTALEAFNATLIDALGAVLDPATAATLRQGATP